MSYEGYERVLCEDGHLHEYDCYEMPDFYNKENPWKCPDCGKSAAWVQGVDLTNGSYCPAWSEEEQRCTDSIPEDYDDCDGEYPYYFCPEELQESCKKSRGRIDGYIELEVITPAETQVCNLGHSHIVKATTYKIPEEGGHRIK